MSEGLLLYLDIGDLSIFGEISKCQDNGVISMVNVIIKDAFGVRCKKSWSISADLSVKARIMPEDQRLLPTLKTSQLIEILKAKSDEKNIARIPIGRIKELCSSNKDLVDAQLLAFADLEIKKN